MITRHSVEKAAFPVMKLGEAVDFLDSRRRPVTESERKAGPYPYYGANGIQGTIDTFIFDESLILLAEDGGHFDEPDRGVAYRISGKTWVNNHAHVLRPKAHLDMAYLCRVLENYDLSPFVSGTTRGKLTKAGACEIPIPVPPLPEQRRIADILDRADALRAKRRAALARLDELTQAIFIEMFGDPVSRGWSVGKIADIVDDKQGGMRTGPFGSQLLHSEFVESGIAVLGIDNAVANEFRWGEQRFITKEKYKDLQRYTVLPGDVIITIMGTCGRCAVVPNDIPTSINTKHLCCITTDKAKCLPGFLHAYFLLHPMARDYLSRTAKGAIMDGLNMGLIKAMPIPLVPVAKQADFITRLRSIQSLRDRSRSSQNTSNDLFASLQDRAFRGAL
jgi:type I restriction enzyme S subunit